MTMDIHAPTVNSSLGAADRPKAVPKTKEELLDIINQKDAVEAELKALGGVLESHGVTMDTSLVDADDFPRNDIDIPQIRTVRARIHHLRNDWKDLMKLIEKGLEVAFEPAAGASVSTDTLSGPAPAAADALEPASEAPLVPFAAVKSVAPTSPAAEAGLQPNDMIKCFGSANALNHQKLILLSEEVKANEGNQIKVILSRKEGGVDRDHIVYLTPRQGWGGRGSLGCHIVPV